LITKLIAGSLLALMLGVAIGMPILIQNLVLGEPPKVYSEVVYAYFGLQSFNENVSGLHSGQVISYVFVLNVTNLSNQLVVVTSFRASAAESIRFHNVTGYHVNATEPDDTLWDNATQVRYVAKGEALGFGSSNVVASRSEDFLEGNEYYWSPNASKLVVLTGMVKTSDLALHALRVGKIYVLSHVTGKVYSNERISISGAYVIKGIEIEIIQGQEFVFNNLLKMNQHLEIIDDGTGVFISSES
jgi:hypothetical protein